MKAGNWYCGPPEGCIEYVQTLQENYPGLEMLHASSSMGTPQQVMGEQLEWFGKEVLPTFQAQKVHAQVGIHLSLQASPSASLLLAKN